MSVFVKSRGMMATYNSRHLMDQSMHQSMGHPGVGRRGNPGVLMKDISPLPGDLDIALLTLGNSDIEFCNK